MPSSSRSYAGSCTARCRRSCPLRAVRIGVAFLVDQPNGWLNSLSAFLHHSIGWMLVVVALFPLGQAVRPSQVVWRAGFAVTFVLLAVLLSPTATSRPSSALRSRARREKTAHSARCPRRRAACAVDGLRARDAAELGTGDAVSGRTPPTEIRCASTSPSRSPRTQSRCWHATDRALGDDEDRGRGKNVVAPVAGLVEGRGYTVRWRVIERRALARRCLHVWRRCGGTPADPGRRCLWHHLARRRRAMGALQRAGSTRRAARRPARDPARPGARAARARLHVVSVVAAFLVIDVGIAGFVLRASNALQLPIADLP